MQAFNLTLFTWLAAGFEPNAFWLPIAALTAQHSAWLCVGLLAWAAWRVPPERWHVLAVMASVAVASMLSHKLAQTFAMPRPFMLGLSPSYIGHGARGALPSTHASVMFTMAFMFLLRPRLRSTGWLLLGVALATALARIYVGVHFPQDIAAGALLAACVALTLNAVILRVRGFSHSRSGYRALAARLSSVMAGGRFSIYFVLLFTVAAFGVGLQAPEVFPLAFFKNGGPVENSTLFFYLAAVAMVATLRLPFVSATDKAATTVVLLAFAAREAGWHSAMFGKSILKAGFYNTNASTPQIAWAIAMLVPVLLATAWLVKRYRQSWRFAALQTQWRPAVFTVLIFALVTVFTSTVDGLPDTLVDFGMLSQVPAGLRQLLVSLEEILELAVPMLVMLAFFQAGFGHRRGAHIGMPAAPNGQRQPRQ